MVQDPIAVDLVQRIDFDFSRFAHLGGSQQVFTMMRTRQMDRWIRSFLAAHPDAVVVDIGCGLDARFERVDNGQVAWYDLDLPNVIALRRQFYAETPRRRFIANSAFDLAWLDQVASRQGQPCLFVSEGVLVYFSEEQVKRLVLALRERFPGAELIFDSVPWVLPHASWMHPTLRTLKQKSPGGCAKEMTWRRGARISTCWRTGTISTHPSRGWDLPGWCASSQPSVKDIAWYATGSARRQMFKTEARPKIAYRHFLILLVKSYVG